jgi:hypothetical protein
MNYCELLWIAWITQNYLDFVLYFTGLLIFQLGYLVFPTGLCFLTAKLIWISMIYCELLWIAWIIQNYLDFVLYFTGLLIFQLGYLVFSTGLWFLTVKLIWISMNYCELFWIAWITQNYLDFVLYFTVYWFFNWATLFFLPGYVFGQINWSEFLWIIVNCSEMLGLLKTTWYCTKF